MSIFDDVVDGVEHAVGAVTNAGQELIVDPIKMAAGVITDNDVATENARQDGARSGTQALKDLNDVLKNPAAARIPGVSKLGGFVTEPIDSFTNWADKEMQNQGINPNEKPGGWRADLMGAMDSIPLVSDQKGTQAENPPPNKPDTNASQGIIMNPGPCAGDATGGIRDIARNTLDDVFKKVADQINQKAQDKLGPLGPIAGQAIDKAADKATEKAGQVIDKAADKAMDKAGQVADKIRDKLLHGKNGGPDVLNAASIKMGHQPRK